MEKTTDKVIYSYNNGEVYTEDKIISLAYIENETMRFLVTNQGKFVNVKVISDAVYGPKVDCCRNVRVSIHRIREKLKGIVRIENKRTFGYRIKGAVKQLDNKMKGE